MELCGRGPANGSRKAPSWPLYFWGPSLEMLTVKPYCKMTFTKTWCGPLLLRTPVFKMRKHLCLFLFYSKVTFPHFLLLVCGRLGFGELVIENSSTK